MWVCSGTNSTGQFLNPRGQPRLNSGQPDILFDALILLCLFLRIPTSDCFEQCINKAFFIHLNVKKALGTKVTAGSLSVHPSPNPSPGPPPQQQCLGRLLMTAPEPGALAQPSFQSLDCPRPVGPLDSEVRQVPQSQHVKTELSPSPSTGSCPP